MKRSSDVLYQTIKTLLEKCGRMVIPFPEGPEEAIAEAMDTLAKDWRLVVPSSWAESKKEDRLFEDEDLKNFPRVNMGFLRAVPKRLVPILRLKGLKFTALKPIAEADLTPKQKEDWRKDRVIMYQWPPRYSEAYFSVDRSLVNWEDLP